MAISVNRKLLPIKAHYLFFFAALGPVLPQMNVFGRQLGISPEVMGLVTAVLPLLWAVAKPTFGLIVDYFTSMRKQIFMLLILVMSSSYCGLWFLPQPDQPSEPQTKIVHINETLYLKTIMNTSYNTGDGSLKRYYCYWHVVNEAFEIYILDITECLEKIYIYEEIDNETCTIYGMEYINSSNGMKCRINGDLICIRDYDIDDNIDNPTKVGEFEDNTKNRTENNVVYIFTNNMTKKDIKFNATVFTDFYGETDNTARRKNRIHDILIPQVPIYGTVTFWGFVILMCIGTVAFNVANCISDAICFDVLGTDASAYGSQRAWGTAGYGVTAFLGGWLVDLSSIGAWKNFTPAFALAAIFTVFDIVSCRRLKLPKLSSAESSRQALRQVLRCPHVILFIVFAVVAGTLDSFIIYYLFWYIEELAGVTGNTANVKLLEGVIVFGQSFIGEMIFFFLSGRILEKFGHGATMTACLLSYAVRLACVSFISNPWMLVPLESVMQGPTYALCYATIVGYAANVAPEGHSATMQGIVAGMDDGVGFALGSLVGGQLYGRVGGRSAFRVMSMLALVAGIIHAALHQIGLVEPKIDKHVSGPSKTDVIHPEEDEKMLDRSQLPTSPHSNVVYCDTVLPIKCHAKIEETA